MSRSSQSKRDTGIHVTDEGATAVCCLLSTLVVIDVVGYVSLVAGLAIITVRFELGSRVLFGLSTYMYVHISVCGLWWMNIIPMLGCDVSSGHCRA